MHCEAPVPNLSLSESRTKQSKREPQGVYHAFDVIVLGCESAVKGPSAEPAKQRCHASRYRLQC